MNLNLSYVKHTRSGEVYLVERDKENKIIATSEYPITFRDYNVLSMTEVYDNLLMGAHSFLPMVSDDLPWFNGPEFVVFVPNARS